MESKGTRGSRKSGREEAAGGMLGERKSDNMFLFEDSERGGDNKNDEETDVTDERW